MDNQNAENAQMTVDEFRKKLTALLEQSGIDPSQFSINDPMPWRMNLMVTPAGDEVWFANASDKYSLQTFSNLSDAVYDFCTRTTNTIAAHQIADSFKNTQIVF